MKKTLFTLLVMLGIQQAWAQFSITGKVVDAESGMQLHGAEIQLTSDEYWQGSSDEFGNFSFQNLPQGAYLLGVSYQGYAYFYKNFKLNSDTTIIVEMVQSTRDLSTLVLRAERVDARVPTSMSAISKSNITMNDQGQDMPFLLNSTPSTVISSDAGNGVGYTGIRIRGIDPTRVNVMINGIPLNDAESQGVFWVDLPDLASSTQEVQVQRGVGTSTNGSASFGASVNLRTDALREDQYQTANLGYGSFNTYRLTMGMGSGLIANKFIFQGRFSYIHSDGFIDRASSDLYAAQVTAGYRLKNGNIKVNVMLGFEETYQAWYGIPQPKFRENEVELNRYISQLWILGDDLDNLQNAGSSTYNYYTYENEIDHYQQNHYQLFFNHKLGEKGIFKVALHTTTGNGYYEQQRLNEPLSNYPEDPQLNSSDTLDLQRRLWLDNIFYGTIMNYFHTNDLGELNIGAALNRYQGLHFGEIISTENTAYEALNVRYYENDAQKSEANFYAKYIMNIKHLHPYIDLQYRMIEYDFLGINRNGQAADQNVAYQFFNPKFGLTYFLTSRLKLYGMYAIGNREPVRDDFVNSTPDSRPGPEKLKDLELGVVVGGYSYNFGFNYFNMQYENALVLNGAINDVGAYTRVNVDESYRKGWEFYASFNITNRIHIAGNYTRSQNKIINYTEYVEEWDDDYSIVPISYEGETSLALSPDQVAFLQLQLDITRSLFFQISWKHVGEQYLDNTESDERKLESFSTLNMALLFNKNRSGRLSRINGGFYLNNVTNVQYAPTGYTFSGIIGGERQSFNYVYPMAGINFMFRIKFELSKRKESGDMILLGE